MNKVKVAIIGPGNIGSDLMYKIMRSKNLEMGAMIGIDPESEGLKRAAALGFKTSSEGIKYIQDNPDCAKIVFDATTAKVHEKIHAPILKELGIIAIDLTPAAVGKICTPLVNMNECINEMNVNLITCGGQATTPIANAVSSLVDIDYLEVITTVASKSAGPGTRSNIDEYCRTTAKALTSLGGAKKSKVFTIFNPAVPEIAMRNTLFFIPSGEFNIEDVVAAVEKRVKEIQEYVPGYELTMSPVIENGYIATTVSVNGAGDFLPSYAGNLDMETSSAVKMAEMFAEKILKENK